jgi:hypothetical protein
MCTDQRGQGPSPSSPCQSDRTHNSSPQVHLYILLIAIFAFFSSGKTLFKVRGLDLLFFYPRLQGYAHTIVTSNIDNLSSPAVKLLPW